MKEHVCREIHQVVPSSPYPQSERGGGKHSYSVSFTMENSNVDLGLSNLTLSVHSSEKVNEMSVVYLLANIPMLVATITINMWVIKMIQGREKNRINRLIVWDCFTGVYTLGYHSTVLGNPRHLAASSLVHVGPGKGQNVYTGSIEYRFWTMCAGSVF